MVPLSTQEERERERERDETAYVSHVSEDEEAGEGWNEKRG